MVPRGVEHLEQNGRRASSGSHGQVFVRGVKLGSHGQVFVRGVKEGRRLSKPYLFWKTMPTSRGWCSITWKRQVSMCACFIPRQCNFDAERKPPALFLLDIMVPGETGLTSAGGCAAPWTFNRPIIFLTRARRKRSRSGPGTGRRRLHYQAISTRELVARVKAVLRRFELRRRRRSSVSKRSLSTREQCS